MVASSSNFYQLGASLPVDAKSYVQRQADEEFYQKLRSGKFCYVLNSRQMGKSSLRVQTMQRLKLDGIICAAIDLTGIGKHKVTLSQWYGGIVYHLVESCQLEDKFDFDWQTWWQKNQEILDPVMCLRLFIEQVLLEKIQQPIVIFVDEIDRVLSQDFSLDDFFALIRFFQNQRVDNPIFERLTFALLGVATPSDLITDKTQTPFNIGEGIELHGFRISEVQPLINGLQGKVSNPQQVMEEILDWTGGQPFLTQKLCKFMVEESEKDNPRSVGEVVRARIIENWESQDDPEHLRTIRDRILSNEQRASYLLELYQLLRQSGEIASNNSIEVSELQLSGLVVKRQEKLRVYNRIYQQIFDSYWIESQLKNLRPYSENFHFWVASGENDKSRLLRGKALQDALSWASDKNLSYQDKQFLAASQTQEREEEIAVKEKEAQLERERKDREAVEQRNQVLAEANQTLTQANKKAKQQIRVGSIFLVVTLSLTGIFGILSVSLGKKVAERNNYLKTTQNYLKTVQELTKLAAQVQDEGSYSEAEELFSQAGQSVNINDQNLKMDILNTGISYAYQKLKSKELQKAQKYLKEVKVSSKDNSPEELQIHVLYLKTQGSLFEKQNNQKLAVDSYTKAFDIWSLEKNKISPFNKELKNRILSSKNVEALHRELISILEKNNRDKSSQQKVEKSLKEHYYAELDNLLKNKKWEAADRLTSKLMVYIANREKEQYLDYDNINSFSCPDLQRINKLWVHSDKRFGFSVQKEIWINTGNKLGIKREDWTTKDGENYYKFAAAVGWYNFGDNETGTVGSQGQRRGEMETYEELLKRIESNPNKPGTTKGRDGNLRRTVEAYRLNPETFSRAETFSPWANEWACIRLFTLFSRCDL